MVKLFDNILPKKSNLNIILDLIKNHHWGFAFDNKENENKLINFVINEGTNLGFYLKTFENNKPILNTPLNIYAKIIVDTVLEKLNIHEDLFIKRFYWNMYFKNSNKMEDHVDSSSPEDTAFLSIIYPLNTNDGGTFIDNKFYTDIMGQVKVFSSEILHRGVAPKNDNIRLNLNIVLKKPKEFKIWQ